MSDYIKREDAASKQFRYLLPNGKMSLPVVFVKDIQQIPAADVAERKSGEWIDAGDFISCSACNATRLKEFESDYGKVMRLDVRTNYCPNCGAEMLKGGES